MRDHAGRACAGLLAGWRRTEGGWMGHVLYMRRDGDRWVPAEDWLPAAALRPAE